MNNVAALQNQLAFDVQRRMKSIESLLEGNSDAPSKPDPEVEYWKAQIRKLSEGGPPTTSQSHNDKISAFLSIIRLIFSSEKLSQILWNVW